MLKEFRDFALKGNVLDMAVGIIIGVAFGTIVTSLVNDVVMPPVGLLLGGVDFSEQYILLKSGDPAGPYPTLAAAKEAGAVALAWGLFLNAVISFLLVAFAVFLIVRSVNRIRQRMEGEKPPAAPAAPSQQEVLLTEIRDLLKVHSPV